MSAVTLTRRIKKLEDAAPGLNLPELSDGFMERFPDEVWDRSNFLDAKFFFSELTPAEMEEYIQFEKDIWGDEVTADELIKHRKNIIENHPELLAYNQKLIDECVAAGDEAYRPFASEKYRMSEECAA